MTGAGAVRVGSFAGTTPAQTAEVNQIKLQAELSRLNQERDVGERRALVAESVANMLYAERRANPFHIAGPPPPPPPAPPTLQANDVAQAVRNAMAGERRTLQDLMAHHGNSMRETIQQSVGAAPLPPPPGSPPGPPPLPPPDYEPGTLPPWMRKAAASGPPVSEIRKKFEKGSKKVSFVGGATAPMPAPPAPEPPRQLSKKERRESIIAGRPLMHGPDVPSGIARSSKRDAETALEDVRTAKRTRANPSEAIDQERRAAKRAKSQRRQSYLDARPIVFGPEERVERKRPAESASSGRTRPNPSAELAKEALHREYRAKTGRKVATRDELRREMQRGLDIIARSKANNPPRMDQFDLKRQVDAIYDDQRVENQRSVKREIQAGSFNITLPRGATA